MFCKQRQGCHQTTWSKLNLHTSNVEYDLEGFFFFRDFGLDLWSRTSEYRSDDIIKNKQTNKNKQNKKQRQKTKTFFFHFSVLDTYIGGAWWKNIHIPNLVGISSWGPEIWPHEYLNYLISPIEIGVNWPGSKQLWIRPIYTHFSGAN